MTLYLSLLAFLSGWFLRGVFPEMEVFRKVVNLIIMLIVAYTLNEVFP